MSNISEVLMGPEDQEINIASAMDYFTLLKPRVMSLVVLTAFIGAFMAPSQMHPYLFFVSILCIAVGAGASGAFNMWYDRDIDLIMSRTLNRPIPAGRINPNDAFTLAAMLAVGSVVTLGFASNILAAGLLAFTIFFYAVIYTIFLKRNTPQNIVIGGAAGAFPPMIGWAAVTNTISLESVILFAIIFLWTPPHFWALALFKSDEYAKAKIPMMPIVAGVESTKTQIVFYSFALGISSLLPFVIGMCGVVYLVSACLLSGIFIFFSLQLKRHTEQVYAKRLFWFSIVYLFLIYISLMIDKVMGLSL